MHQEVMGPQKFRRLFVKRLRPHIQARHDYVIALPWWRRPFIGYLCTFPLIALALLIPMALAQIETRNYFIGAPLFLVTVFIALIWGTGPSIFSIILGILSLNYFVIPPTGAFSWEWHNVLPTIPFFLAQLIVALITGQREAARHKTMLAEQKAQERATELEKANQLKDHFLSMASHELKTPITTIRAHIQLMRRRLAQQPLPTEYTLLASGLEKLELQSQRLNALVDDLLDASILSTGKIPLHRKQCDVGELSREVIEEQQALTGRCIALHIASPPVLIQADCDRLSQVMINLVTNAIKYSPEKSLIEVTIRRDARQVVIEVHNEGSVIPQEQQEHIFEPFYRAPDAHHSSKKGWGLGLAICQQIVERHGGHIKVESSAEQGTTFIVELPA